MNQNEQGLEIITKTLKMHLFELKPKCCNNTTVRSPPTTSKHAATYYDTSAMESVLFPVPYFFFQRTNLRLLDFTHLFYALYYLYTLV